MLSTLLPLTLSSLLVSALPSPNVKDVVKRTSSGVPYSPHSIPIAAKVPRPAALERAFAEKVRALDMADGKNESMVSLTGTGGGVSYALNLTIADQTFLVIADTGSSDLWLYSSNFTCLNVNSTQVPQAECNFGPTGINLTADGFTPLNYTNNFNISYGDGTFLSGTAGTDTVTVGNISVKDTEFSVAEVAYWNGDGFTDGLLGLAAPLLTSVYYGSDGSVDGRNNSALYQPWFYKAVSEGLVEPYFSLVLNRPTLTEEEAYNNTVPDLGAITFGGIPEGCTTDTTVTVPNINFTTSIGGYNHSVPAYYTTSSTFKFPGSKSINTTTPRIILDSGTTLIYLTDEIATEYNKHWNPPAQFVKEDGIYFVDCNAKAPSLTVVIGGVDFEVDSRDLIYSATDGVSNDCISSVVPGDSLGATSVSILGDRFLVNVVSTFNIATGEITVTQRKKY